MLKFCGEAPWFGKRFRLGRGEKILVDMTISVQVLPNVHLYVSVENQLMAERRIPWLIETPAAVRGVSYEPALKGVDFTKLVVLKPKPPYGPGAYLNALTGLVSGPDDVLPSLDHIIIGGESGPDARPFNIEWARATVEQCKAAGVSCFVKQIDLDGRVSKDMDEWPEWARVREFPEGVV